MLKFRLTFPSLSLLACALAVGGCSFSSFGDENVSRTDSDVLGDASFNEADGGIGYYQDASASEPDAEVLQDASLDTYEDASSMVPNQDAGFGADASADAGIGRDAGSSMCDVDLEYPQSSCTMGDVCSFVESYGSGRCRAPGTTPEGGDCSPSLVSDCEPGTICTGVHATCKRLCRRSGTDCMGGDICEPLLIDTSGRFGVCVPAGARHGT